MILTHPIPDLISLDLLRSVAEMGSITRAAEVHRISQPAASMRIRDLERVLGVKLVQRRGSGTVLTTQGEVVVEWAGKIIDEVRSLQAAAQALRSDHHAHLELGASLTVAEYLIPNWLATFRHHSPATGVALQMGNSTQVAEMVRAGRVELGFLEGPRAPSDLETQTIRKDRLVVVVSSGHPWSKRASKVSVDEFVKTPLLLREQGSGTREVLEEAVAALGRQVIPFAEIASTTAIKAAIRSGLAPAVMSSLAVADEIDSGALTVVTVQGLELTRSIRAAYRADRALSQPALVFLALVA
ncbi:MAG: LysR family transcriptional regulator [Acidimicrobiales bacterium]